MNDFLAEMWPAFEAEVSEQLDALEQYLVRGGSIDSGIDIDAVFRQFHTIKSTSAMMDFRGMEAVAHAAEDLLERVRRGQRAFDEACRAAVLRAVDTLRRQLAEALASRQSPAADPALVAELRALAGAPGKTASAPAETATSADLPGENIHAGMAQAVEPAATPLTALDAYLAQTATLLPALASACAGEETLPALDALIDDATAAGLVAIATAGQQLVTSAGTAQQLPAFCRLLARHAHVEKLAGRDAGSRDAGIALRARRPQLLATPLAAAQLAADSTLATAEDAARWLPAVTALLEAPGLAGLPHSARVLRVAAQALRELARGSRPVDAAIAENLALVLRLPQELDPRDGEDALYVTMAEKLLARLQDVLAAAPGALATQQATLPAGHTLVEIDADLESLPDSGAAFIEWLSTSGKLLGSRTLFAGDGEQETTRLCFVATMPLDAAAIRATLDTLDPDGKHLQLRRPASEMPAKISAPLPAGAAPAPGEAAATAATGNTTAGNTLRIESNTLDTFVNRLGELVMLRNVMAHTLADNEITHGLQRLRDILASSGVDPDERAQLLNVVSRLGSQRDNLLQADNRLQQTLGRLQDDVLALRVVPVGIVFNRMTRIIRQVADTLGKRVRLDISGDDVRIDKSMIELLVEPLTHLVRNAVDHGLEREPERLAAGKDGTGALRLAARQQGNAILVTIADDGRGLDHARILERARALGLAGAGDYAARDIANFIFAPGFSTAAEVTAVSGRGVGMDVVKTRIAQVGGQVDVQSEPGRGTTFTLRLPLSVAIQNVVVVSAGGRQHALPERNVNELLKVAAADVQQVRNQAAILLRGQTLPLYRLDVLLGRAEPAASTRDLQVLVISDGAHRIGLVVDDILGRQEVFVRDIHPQLMRLPGVGGAAILGDGQVIVIADCDNLLRLAKQRAQSLSGLLRAS